MPYIYSLAGAVYFEDYTIMRSLLFDFPEDREARKVENEFMFVKKFYGLEEANRTMNNIKCAHVLRKILLRIGYWKKDREDQLEKTTETIRMLDEISTS